MGRVNGSSEYEEKNTYIHLSTRKEKITSNFEGKRDFVSQTATSEEPPPILPRERSPNGDLSRKHGRLVGNKTSSSPTRREKPAKTERGGA